MTIKFGINLSSVYYNTDSMVNNLVKNSGILYYYPNNNGFTFDSNGNVSSMPATSSYTLSVIFPPSFTGSLTASYTGSGNVIFRGVKNTPTTNNNVTSVNFLVETPNSQFFIDVKNIDPSNYPRLFDVRPSGLDYQGIYNPAFLAAAAPFTAGLRFVNTLEINGQPGIINSVVNWNDRTPYDYITWVQITAPITGAPVEFCIGVANELNTNPWIQIPPQASNDYCQQLANYLKANLNAGLKPLIEYGNEMWNPTFPQYNWVTQQANAAGISRGLWLGQRNNTIFQIFKTTLGASNVTCVLGAFVCGIDSEMMSAATLKDAVCIAPYVLWSPGQSDLNYALANNWFNCGYEIGLNGVFQKLAQGQTELNGCMSQWRTFLDANYPTLPLLAYESGQSLVPQYPIINDSNFPALFSKAQDDPRMATVYANLYNSLVQYGISQNFVFDLCYTNQKYGEWGLVQRYDNTNTVKYQEILREIALNM
jgi:hypothetical protein